MADLNNEKELCQSRNTSASEHSRRDTTYTGGDQPHNNMPPYHVVQFIEYVGFKLVEP